MSWLATIIIIETINYLLVRKVSWETVLKTNETCIVFRFVLK